MILHDFHDHGCFDRHIDEARVMVAGKFGEATQQEIVALNSIWCTINCQMTDFTGRQRLSLLLS